MRNPSFVSSRSTVLASVRKALVVFVLFAAFAFIVAPVYAQAPQAAEGVQQVAQAAGVGNVDLFQLIGRIINIFLGFLGVILLGLLLYAGFTWMTAGGDETKVKSAKTTIRNAIIGLVIIASAWAITAFIFNSLTGAGIGGGVSGTGGGGFGGGLVGSSGSLGNGIIEYHLPERNATNVPRNTPVIITFKQPINPASFIDGWTEATSSTVNGLNVANVKLFKTGDASTALTSADARVNVTADHRTYVIRPVSPLGSTVSNIKYTVQLAGGNAGILLEAGGAAFAGAFNSGYEWGFEVSTFLDTTPPKVVAAIPYVGGTYARNIIIQVTFNEAIDPTTASGIFQGGAGFSNIQIRPDSGAGTPLDGEFRISNQYRTVEFLSSSKCGVNSCGRDVFCLPPSATLETTVNAATLSSQPPQAQFTNQGYDGLTDVVGNSLDGNGNGNAEGTPQDNYVWSFGTTNQVKLSPPRITATVPESMPGAGQSNRPLDETVNATFDGLMQASSFTSDAASIEPRGPNETDPDTFWWIVGMELVNATGMPIQPGEQAAASQLTIRHRPYVPSGLLPTELNYYNPFLLSDLQDAYQNCFNPSSSVNALNPAQSCTGLPNCCNNSPKTQACSFTP
ncbi:MAG: hypothetical protein ABIO72_05150 [Patescibacteria group bacterium]